MGLGPFHARLEQRIFSPLSKALYREQALAIFRLVAALACTAAYPLLRTLTVGHQTSLHLILIGYGLSSLVILARFFFPRPVSPFFFTLVHVSDVVWPSLICLFTGCVNSPFLLLYAFALLAAPYRARTLETLAITLSTVLIVLSETVVATLPSLAFLHLLRWPMQLGAFTVRASILFTLCGFLSYTAYWTQREQQAYVTRSILRRLHARAGIQANLREILPALLSIFEAKRVILVLRDASTWRVFQWGIRSDDPELPASRDLSAAEVDQYFWPMPSAGWSLAWSRAGFLVLDREGIPIRHASDAPPAGLPWDPPVRTLLATNLQFGSEWNGRIFLLDPHCPDGRESSLRLLHQVVEEVGPAVYNFYLWQHTSVRIRALERQQLARDLHDGVVQSVIAAEMRLELLRRRIEKQDASATVSEAIEGAQNILRGEVRRLREQIDQLRSNPSARPVSPWLSEILAAFQRDTGIRTSFACNVQEKAIPSRVSSEVIRIVEEALSNVRRHSGAQKVDVHLTARRDTWEIVIQDDGRGFDFTGRLSLAELEAARIGPRVIRERVHSVNGDLTLESWPNQGARLEIRFAPPLA